MIITKKRKYKIMPKKEPKICSVVTLPLKTEIWQRDKLDKKFETARKIYNAMLAYELKQLEKLKSEQRYIDAQTVLTAEYEQNGSRKNRKKTSAETDAYKTINELYKEYGFSEFGFTSVMPKFAKHFSNSIPSRVAACSIAKPMWAAFDKLLFHEGNTVHFKKQGQWNSLMSYGNVSISLTNSKGERCTAGGINDKYFITYTAVGGKTMNIPIVMPKNDFFKQDMFTREIRNIRITRKIVKGTSHYYVQLVVEGAPAPKYDKDGNFKNTMGTGKVELNINTVEISAATEDNLYYWSLRPDEKHAAEIETKIAEIDRYMDRSRRTSNPDNYNEDGTVKKGVVEDGTRRKLHWTYSKNYQKARAKRADILRKEAETRKLKLQKIANEILALGNDFTVNDYNFKAAQQRKTEDKLTKNGTPASKAKAGKKIGSTAPSTLLMLLEQKIKAQNGTFVRVKKEQQTETTEEEVA